MDKNQNFLIGKINSRELIGFSLRNHKKLWKTKFYLPIIRIEFYKDGKFLVATKKNFYILNGNKKSQLCIKEKNYKGKIKIPIEEIVISKITTEEFYIRKRKILPNYSNSNLRSGLFDDT